MLCSISYLYSWLQYFVMTSALDWTGLQLKQLFHLHSTLPPLREIRSIICFTSQTVASSVLTGGGGGGLYFLEGQESGHERRAFGEEFWAGMEGNLDAVTMQSWDSTARWASPLSGHWQPLQPMNSEDTQPQLRRAGTSYCCPGLGEGGQVSLRMWAHGKKGWEAQSCIKKNRGEGTSGFLCVPC